MNNDIIQAQPLLGNIVLGLAALVLIAIAAAVIGMLFRGTARDRIAGLLFEVRPDGQAGKPSVSRLQMLIWNFVVAFAFLYVLGTRAELSKAIDAIFQPEILALLGISNVTYLLGKRTRQGSALPQAGTAEAMAERGGQPAAPGEPTIGGPGPQGTQ